MPRLVEREHRLQRLALEGQLAVGVVLEDPEVVLGGELDQAPALLGRERAAGRVVGVGDDVGELDRPLGERRFQRADVEPVGLQRDRHQLDPELLQQQQGAVVGRLLDDDPVARPEQVLEEHRARLERAVGDHHLRRVEAPVPLRHPLAEPGMADPDAVGERRFPVLGKRPRRRLPHRSCGRMSALGAPRANEIVSPAIATDPSNASRLRAASRAAQHFDGDLRRLGRAFADPHALCFERVFLRLGGARGAGDDRAGVAHLLAGRGGEAGDVGDDRLGDLGGDELGRPLLGVAADLADHHDQLGLGVGLVQREDVDEVGADDRVAADADDRGVAGRRPASARCRSGRSACRDLETTPIGPGSKNWAGMMPTLALPGESTPGQLGPISRTPASFAFQ